MVDVHVYADIKEQTARRRAFEHNTSSVPCCVRCSEQAIVASRARRRIEWCHRVLPRNSCIPNAIKLRARFKTRLTGQLSGQPSETAAQAQISCISYLPGMLL
jgi:hypothetical protein